jgi:curved DNA-binding protein CbpA
MARRYHPDAGHGSSSEKFRQATEAYETLSDSARRRGYDLSLPRSEPAFRMPVRVEPITAPLRREVYVRVVGAPHSLLFDLLRVFEDDDRFFLRWG